MPAELVAAEMDEFLEGGGAHNGALLVHALTVSSMPGTAMVAGEWRVEVENRQGLKVCHR